MARPTVYRPEYAKQAQVLCSEYPLTNKKLARVIGVSANCINTWRHRHKEFDDAIRNGKALKDQEVERALFERAVGYSHPDTYFYSYEGKLKRAKTRKHYPPSEPAAIFWLKNRQPGKWRDSQQLEHSGGIAMAIDPKLIAAAVEAAKNL